MCLAVIAPNLAGFGLVVVSQRIWRSQFISATATAPIVGSTMLGVVDRQRYWPLPRRETTARVSTSRTSLTSSFSRPRGRAQRPARHHGLLRGGKAAVAAFKALDFGSSPHSRGVPRRPGLHRRRVRIIPAFAGSTTLYSSFRRIRAGSSPHRGEHFDHPGPLERDSRIIPAFRGSTILARIPASAISDHPRIRGEHLQRTAIVGSTRIIPAFAGCRRRLNTDPLAAGWVLVNVATVDGLVRLAAR
jgi:hypothetical protein